MAFSSCFLSLNIWIYNPIYSQNAGQNCIGIERILVHSSQHDDLLSELSNRARNLRLGPPLQPSAEGYIAPIDVGAMISADRFDELERLVRNAERDGAQVSVGGKRWRHPYADEGAYFAGTVVGHVEAGMEIANTER